MSGTRPSLRRGEGVFSQWKVRQMDFGLYLPCYCPDTSYPAERLYRDALEQAQLAEDLGMGSVSIPEHHFVNYLIHPNPLLTALKVTENTRRLRVMIAVHVLPFYDMRRLAGEIAQADCLTMGRIEYGVGRGAFRYEFERMSRRLEDSREWFIDSIKLLEKLLTEEEVSWKSKWYDFPPLTIMPRPYQKPRPPIWIAALAPEAIASSAKLGYHVMTTPLRDPWKAAKGQVDAFMRAVAEMGECGRRLRFSTLRMTYVARNEADKRDKLRLALENHRRFSNLFDTPGEVRGGAVVPLDHVDLTEEDMEKALIIGSAQEVLDKMQAFAGLGTHNMQVNSTFGASHKDVMGALERFAAHVMPHFERHEPRAAAAGAA